MFILRYVIFAFLISALVAGIIIIILWLVQHKLRYQEEKLEKWQRDQEAQTDKKIIEMYKKKK